ncbi:hypothetical protein SEVIR_6G029500v4 [Setaria viridis]|uniref:F-box domain-containing protein n=1 Tax=Setaria viridis TaxID=4556 RepID=A0A4U6U305_SETVI|nr:uncharacterized protein LOC117861587 [Setaria viridis]TKW08464.1 hypothetical protein SEVIR_6G029500v2 [Setaria viridis]
MTSARLSPPLGFNFRSLGLREPNTHRPFLQDLRRDSSLPGFRQKSSDPWVGVPDLRGRAGHLFDAMPPKVTKRWVPVNRVEGAPCGGGGGDPATARRSVLPDAPLHHRLVPPKNTTPPKGTMRWVPVNRAGGTAASRGREGGVPDADRLSALPDALLHHIMSFLKAWEVVRTCVLSWQWRHLWASAPCIDLRIRGDDNGNTPEDFPDFVRHLFRRREVSAKLDTVHLRSSDDAGAHDVRLWIRTAIKQGARVIHLVGHRKEHWLRGSSLAVLEHASFVSCHLKILKLSYALIDENILRQLSSHCPSLEELNLKDCLITGHEISSASLKVLTMFKCQINVNLSISAPNLVVLRCISPITQAPSFENMGFLVTGTIILDDYAFGDDFEDISKYERDATTDEDDDCSDSNWKNKTRYGFGAPLEGYGLGYKDDYGYGSDIESDGNTFEYSEIAIDCDEYGINGDGHNSTMDGNRQISGENSGCNDNKIKGGHNVLQSLSNATSLELLADAGEVILTRELKRCPSFSNLKTLSLGEWSMDAGFDALVFLLQHSPNLERLFLELKLNFNNKKPLVSSVKPKEKSFSCKRLQLVKIKCSKDDARVHKLAHLFRTNGISVDKIFVRRTGSAYLRGNKLTKDLARLELEFWGKVMPTCPV